MGSNGVSAMNTFLSLHRAQLEGAGVPEKYWATLQNKLTMQQFDAGASFGLLQVEYEDNDSVPEDKLWRVESIADIDEEDPDHIYLIDHAWTFTTSSAREQLEANPGLTTRMAELMGLNLEEGLVEAVMKAKWKYCQTYSLASGTAEERQPIWYIMDEFGSRIPHSSSPTVRIVPFIWNGDGLGYSILFPVSSLEAGAEITRDYVEGLERGRGEEARRALLCAWYNTDFTHLSSRQEEPGKDFFLAARQMETLPDTTVTPTPLPCDRPIKVYSEYEFINKHLTHARFTMTDNLADADILWLSSHFKDYRGLSLEMPEKRINQFPCESVITIKDFLSVVCRRRGKCGMDPKWLPTTYNLETELEKFISCYQDRQKKGEDNHWIVKAWNLSRGLDMQVASSLSHILRLPASGPKIAQKYLNSPVLFDRPSIGMVKFDIRYIILLKSVEPLEVYAYNRFWLRFANLPFSLELLDVYEKHFTVMNYSEGTELKQMFCNDFIRDFEEQYPDHPWREIEESIFSMLKNVFLGATALPPPSGIGACPQAGAMYATDLMLDWEGDGEKKRIQPKVLEFNWMPDCERACDYYPEFFNNVFSTLFLGESSGQNVTML